MKAVEDTIYGLVRSSEFLDSLGASKVRETHDLSWQKTTAPALLLLCFADKEGCPVDSGREGTFCQRNAGNYAGNNSTTMLWKQILSCRYVFRTKMIAFRK